MPDTNTFALTWDADGTRYYHTGVSRGVIYPMGENNATALALPGTA